MEETKVKGFVPLTGISLTVAEGNERNSPAVKTVQNIPTKLTVTAKDTETGEALVGSEYQVKDEDGNVILLEDLGNGIYRPSRTGEGVDHVTVGESGVCVVKYLEGDVTITQSKTIPGYTTADPVTVTVGEDPVEEGSTNPDAGNEPADMSVEALAVEISTDFAREIAPFVDGFYLVTPFGRTSLIARILDRFHEEALV